jgi:lipid A 3-O-deacylase
MINYIPHQIYSSSHRVSRRPWVAQAAIGISSQWLVSGHGVPLALMRVWRTREFDEQLGHHAFGSIALSFEI